MIVCYFAIGLAQAQGREIHKMMFDKTSAGGPKQIMSAGFTRDRKKALNKIPKNK
jgi:hypothetical protein